METSLDLQTAPLSELGMEVQQALEGNQLHKAVRLAETLLDETAKLRIASAFPSWALAFAHHLQGANEKAFGLIRKALDFECCAPRQQSAYGAIVQKLRESLAELPSNHESVASIHAHLNHFGEADAQCHVAMLAHLLATGKVEEAERLATALTITAPHTPECWAALAAVAKSRGDTTMAAMYESQAAIIAAASVGAWSDGGALEEGEPASPHGEPCTNSFAALSAGRALTARTVPNTRIATNPSGCARQAGTLSRIRIVPRRVRA